MIRLASDVATPFCEWRVPFSAGYLIHDVPASPYRKISSKCESPPIALWSIAPETESVGVDLHRKDLQAGVDRLVIYTGYEARYIRKDVTLTKRLVDIDDTDLRIAQEARGLTTIKDTVAAGLREIAATEARKREIARLTSGYLASLADTTTRQDAWR